MGVRQLKSGYNTSILLPFEHYNEMHFFHWLMPTNWLLCFWSSAIYLAVIYIGRRLMEKRERFELRTPLMLWNMALGLFSICGAVRMNQELWYVVGTYGFQYSFCVSSYGQIPFGFWVVCFTLSKVVELGDTVFIVLRKQPLIFLHWYHHIATLIFTWIAYTERMSSGRWFITMNYTVHGVMYTYYTIRAMRVHVPRWVNVCITTAQTLQMVVGLAVNIGVVLVKQRGEPCNQSYGNITLALVMYLSYFVLFSWYFYNAYIRPKPRKPAAKVPATPQKPHLNGVYNSGASNRTAVEGTRNGVKYRGASAIGVKTGAIDNGLNTRGTQNGVKKYN